MELNAWGLSCSIDVEGCNPELIQSAAHIQDYIIQLCKKIDMKRYGDAQITYFGSGEFEGFTMMQLIETSAIMGHFSNARNAAYIDIFSCKDYDAELVRTFSQEFFQGATARCSALYRGSSVMTREKFHNLEEGDGA